MKVIAERWKCGIGCAIASYGIVGPKDVAFIAGENCLVEYYDLLETLDSAKGTYFHKDNFPIVLRLAEIETIVPDNLLSPVTCKPNVWLFKNCPYRTKKADCAKHPMPD